MHYTKHRVLIVTNNDTIWEFLVNDVMITRVIRSNDLIKCQHFVIPG